MKKTKIDWADSTWNPVTGCLHGCEYCYARGIANRFAGCDKLSTYMPNCQATWRRVNPDSKPEDAIFEVDAQCPPINIFFRCEEAEGYSQNCPVPMGISADTATRQVERTFQLEKASHNLCLFHGRSLREVGAGRMD